MLFLLGHPHNSIVVSTAPTWPQVENLLWREVRASYQRAQFPIGGRMLTTRLEFGPKWYGIGLSTDQGVNLQGYHADNILIIIDEADGVAPEIWGAIDGLTTTYGAKLLAIGNPLDPQSEFKKRTDLAAGKAHARVIRISAYDTPNLKAGRVVFPFLVTAQWVQDKLELWGPDSPMAMGKIFGQWPDQGPDTAVPMAWLQRAKGREVARGPRGLGVDVARYGRDRTVRTLMEGGMYMWSRPMQGATVDVVAGAVIADVMAYNPALLAIDGVGIGAGVVDLARARLGDRLPIIDFNASSKALNEERFVNRAAEWWYNTRVAFETNKVGFMMTEPDVVDALINELNRAKFDYDERGRWKIDKYGLARGKTPKGLTEEQLAARSPDLADSFVLAYNAALPFADLREEAGRYEPEVDWWPTGAGGRRA